MSNTTDATTVRLPDFTSFQTKMIAVLILNGVIQPPIFLFGFIANLANIVIFLKLGLRDSISICFFVLSCTDLVCVVLLIVSDLGIMLSGMFWERWRVDGEDFCWLTIYYYGTVYDISQGITTFIAVQRCWCVALPFRFKNTFTTTRTSVILTGISLIALSFHVPILASQDLVDMFDPVTNRTLFKLWTSEIRAQVYPVVGLMSLVFTTTCQATVVFCLIVLASGLRASSKFRNSSAVANNDALDLKSNDKKPNGQHSTNMTDDKIISKKQGKDVLDSQEISSALRPAKTTSRKELQALRSATFVSILFVVCNTFKLLDYYIILCISDYNPFGRFVNTYMVANDTRFTIEAMDISFNVFVYLKFNSRFRSTLFSRVRRADCKLSSCVR